MDPQRIARGDFLDDDLPVEESEKEAVTEPEGKAEPEAEKETVAEPEAEKEEPEAEEAAEEETPRDEKGRFAGIPKARFDEAVGKEREAREAAERRAIELERQLVERQQTVGITQEIEKIETSISELETKYQGLLIDGESAQAAEVMRQIRHSERQIARIEAQQDAAQTTNQILEAERFELAVAKIEAEHHELNPQSETYDGELVEMILDRQSRLVQQGLAPSKALAEATGFVLRRAARETPAEPEQGLAAAKAPDRKAAQVAKNLEAQKQQPPSMKDVGMDSDKLGEKGLPNISQMTLEEFEALPESTRARMRGDML